MYRPPQNSNRVKSITSKFENIENKDSPEKEHSDNNKNGTRSNLTYSPKKVEVLRENTSTRNVLSRQYSDPLKRNIKRTPAFRLDSKSTENNDDSRNNLNCRTTLFENKVKQFNSALKTCDNIHTDLSPKSHKSPSNKDDNIEPSCSNQSKPMLFKSKSSHDFQYIRNKFVNSQLNNNNSEKIDIEKRKINGIKNKIKPVEEACLKNVDLSLLYTEPIPKSLRHKPILPEISVPKTTLESNIYSSSTLKLSDKFPKVKQQPDLTDTLKNALKKPLPPGPAPQKPPRTFQHCVDEVIKQNSVEKNASFLHLSKEIEQKLCSSKASCSSSPLPRKKEKADPKYMLNKLENALRNNRLRARKQAKTDISTTSGEDSDDSLLFRSKSERKPSATKTKLPPINNGGASITDSFNCFNSFKCANPAYERVREPTSSFFVENRKPEPVYAEPFGHNRDDRERFEEECGFREERTPKKSNRNSLYYMSTAVLSDGEPRDILENSYMVKQESDMGNQQKMPFSLNTQISAENSSLSSFTSDLDTPSPMDDSNTTIKSLINSFEAQTPYTTSTHNSPNNIYDKVNVDNTNRVEILKNSLQKTLERSFNNENTTVRESPGGDLYQNDNENRVADIITKFQTYIKSMPKYSQPVVNKDTLFYCCLVIEKVSDCAHIKFKFPQNADVPPDIESLCFPERDSLSLDCSHTSQIYSLLLTNSLGERTFGYCRRVLPEGSTQCLPLAYCILSKYRAPRFYKKVLEELESRHGIRNKFRDELISQFYNHKFPKPGESIRINLSNIEPKIYSSNNNNNKTDDKRALVDNVDLTSFVYVNKKGEYGTINNVKRGGEAIYLCENDMKHQSPTPSYVVDTGEKAELVLTLHPDIRYEDSDLKRLHKLPVDILLKIFSSLLLERKVILIGSVISELSSCVDSLQTILYPFTWHHTFIPILPESLWDIVESPTPVICGVLSQEVFEHHKIENGIVVDLDSKSIKIEEGDENKILSGSMQKIWKKSIALANKAAASIDYVHSIYLADAYLQVFILCLKDYKSYVSNGIFQKDELVKHAKTKGIRRFLKMFTETYMFHAFVDSVLTDPGSLSTFDKKIEMYGSEESSIVLDKLLEWNR